MRTLTRLLAIASTVAIVLPATAAVAGGGDHRGGHRGAPRLSDPLASGLAGPLQISVDHGVVYVAHNFAGVVSIVSRRGQRDIPVPNIDGLDAKHGRILFTTRADAPPGVPLSSRP